MGQEEASEEGTQGHAWYPIRSKYGKAFQGTAALLQEGQKVIDTHDGKHGRLSSLAIGLLEQLTNFRGQSSDRDEIVSFCHQRRATGSDPAEPQAAVSAEYLHAWGPARARSAKAS